MSRPGILFLSQCLPFPPNSGVTRRTYNIVIQLQKEFDVFLIPYYRKNHQKTSAELSAALRVLSSQLAHVATPQAIQAEHFALRRVWDHVRSLIGLKPYTYYEHESAYIDKEIDRLCNDPAIDIRLAHVDSLDLARWLQVLPRPRVVTHHSIESELLQLRATVVRNPALASYLSVQARLVRRSEEHLCPQVDLNVMMSDLDAGRLKRLAPGTRTFTVTNGVDIDFFQPDDSGSRRAGVINFLGPLYMLPNSDAVDYFVEAIWPSVRARYPGAIFEMIGSCSDADRQRLERIPGVSCLGFVDDIRPPILQADCCVVPLRVGGGTRLKILDAWAMGKAVVSTAIGCEGLAAVDGENILIRDEPEDFAEAVVEVLTNDGLRQRLGREGRRVAESKYSWDAIGQRMRGEYWRLMKGPLYEVRDPGELARVKGENAETLASR